MRDLPGGRRMFSAEDRRARMRGLAGLDDLPVNWALHLAPCRSIHTVGMRFPLGLVWLDGAGAVVRVDETVPPRRLRTCLRARSVVETRAGEASAFARLVAGEPASSVSAQQPPGSR